MSFVKFLLDEHFGNYCSRDASSIAMNILGNFLTDDAIYNPSSFKEYAFNEWEECTSSNATALEKDNGYILLTDLCSEEEVPTVLKMTQSQFIQILDEWEEKACRLRPKEIIIKYENDQFVMETKD